MKGGAVDQVGQAQEGHSEETSVFVSYSRADQQAAKRVIALLKEAGFTVWWDGELEAGTQYLDTTEQALESAEAVVVLWTQTSTGSNWVRDEAMSGRDRNCLIPVSLDGSVAPLGFRQFQALDFSGWTGKASDPIAQKLVDAVAAMHGREVAPMPSLPPARASGLSRRNLLLAGVAGMVAAAGGVALWQSGLLDEAAETNSIAVLPFRNLSGDAEQDYFSAGLAEELRVTLSLNPQLLVAAETSSRIFGEAQEDIAEIAERLGVAYVLEGSVRRSTDLLRITARLVDVASGFEVWSQAFERDPANTLELHSELATRVVDELFSTEQEGVLITQRPGGTQSSEALDHYLHGLALIRLGASDETDREALEEFEQAITIDPGYAVGYATYGWSMALVAAANSDGEERDRLQQRARELALRAIELEPDAPEGHAALGLINQYDLDFRNAREPYQTSFELGFGNAQIIGAYAQFAAYIGEFEQAQEAMARAERLDPLNAQVFRSAAFIDYLAGDFESARANVQAALALNDQVGTVWRLLGDMAVLDGDSQAAREFYQKEPRDLGRLPGLAIVEDRLEGREAGEARIAEMVAAFGDNSLYQQAQVLAMWGETERALDALEAGLAEGDPGLARLRVDPLLTGIRQEPRFAAILERLGLS